jgi:hypothetical protein
MYHELGHRATNKMVAPPGTGMDIFGANEQDPGFQPSFGPFPPGVAEER